MRHGCSAHRCFYHAAEHDAHAALAAQADQAQAGGQPASFHQLDVDARDARIGQPLYICGCLYRFVGDNGDGGLRLQQAHLFDLVFRQRLLDHFQVKLLKAAQVLLRMDIRPAGVRVYTQLGIRSRFADGRQAQLIFTIPAQLNLQDREIAQFSSHARHSLRRIDGNGKGGRARGRLGQIQKLPQRQPALAANPVVERQVQRAARGSRAVQAYPGFNRRQIIGQRIAAPGSIVPIARHRRLVHAVIGRNGSFTPALPFRQPDDKGLARLANAVGKAERIAQLQGYFFPGKQRSIRHAIPSWLFFLTAKAHA